MNSAGFTTEDRQHALARVGVVAIGRNEGDRLQRCLRSISHQGLPIVYVDSGSTDGSVALATSLECDVVTLDSSRPFTAARARNCGFARLLEIAPNCEFVQFVDGDCEIADGWISTAAGFLQQNKDHAVVCGRRRECAPRASLYNRLCDMEWNTPMGDADACGGDSLMRVAPFQEVGGFDGALIAGEEPELCSRLRHAGWRIMRLPCEMTIHDANITHFGQWWRRMVRAGWAEMDALLNRHGRLRSTCRAWVWCIVMPLFIVAIVGSFPAWGALAALAYPLCAARAARTAVRRGDNSSDALLYGVFCVIGKPAELQGQLLRLSDRFRGRLRHLIEYK